MARGGVNSLFKNLQINQSNLISMINSEMQTCSSSTRVASHLSNNSSCNDYQAHNLQCYYSLRVLNLATCLHQNLEGRSQELENSQNHVSKESIACGSETTDSNAVLELAFFRQRQQITTEAMIGAGTRHAGLYKKGKIRVQVILNQECFHLCPRL